MSQLVSVLSAAKVYDLAQPYFVGMPHYPTHPPFLFSLTKLHGDFVAPNGASSSAEAITLGGHVGTHIDALAHFSRHGQLHDGAPVAGAQSHAGGIGRLSVDTISPILRRGILLDVAGYLGLEALPVDFGITPEHLEETSRAQGVEILPGDVVLVRTGWARYFRDPQRYISGIAGPGPELPGAVWLGEHGVFAAGSDTVAFERVPNPELPVHVHLLVEKGIHIIEVLDLEPLAADRVYEFAFVAAPLKIRGATGSPIRPLALVG